MNHLDRGVLNKSSNKNGVDYAYVTDTVFMLF